MFHIKYSIVMHIQGLYLYTMKIILNILYNFIITAKIKRPRMEERKIPIIFFLIDFILSSKKSIIEYERGVK